MHDVYVSDWRPDTSTEFVFSGYDWQPKRGRLALHYRLDGIRLSETFCFPTGSPGASSTAPSLVAAMELLYWTAGISYWKAGCPQRVIFENAAPDQWQAEWLNRLYREGLAEFAFRQALSADRFEVFSSDQPRPSSAPAAGLDHRFLVPMGGGKDSLVAWDRLNRIRRVAATVQVGQSALIAEVAERTGSPNWQIRREIDPKLAELNRAGALNGHVPITAINSAALIVLALMHGHGGIAFANERSADEPTLISESGQSVNHQFSKSLAFEVMLDAWVRHYIAADLAIFSVLRRDRELGVCKAFAELTQFHHFFSSCNRNFHLDGPRTDRWCRRCPKCRFVFLGLAPFLPPDRLAAIFGADLLDDPLQIPGFAELLALDGEKPFECVGEANEARSAIRALSESAQWHDHAVVGALMPKLYGLDVPDLKDLCVPGGSHLIPDVLLHETGSTA